ncbi:MAG: hypothetical protein RIM99_06745 [Cyclobacteriaceae bacterium]
MPITKYLNRLERMDALIRRKSTGAPEQFAEKMNMSRSALMRNLAELKKLEAPIEYDSYRQTYYYSEEVELNFGFKKISATKMGKMVGGDFSRKNLAVPKYETNIVNIYGSSFLITE